MKLRIFSETDMGFDMGVGRGRESSPNFFSPSYAHSVFKSFCHKALENKRPSTVKIVSGATDYDRRF